MFSVHLKPLESLLLVFSDESGEVNKAPKQEVTIGLNLDKDWDAEFFTPEGKSFRKKIENLKDLSQTEGLESFGGTIIYRKTFNGNKQTKLDLGKVAETAEVILNGKNLGVKWWGEKHFDVSGELKQGENQIEIKVTTLLWNYCNSKSMEENPMAKLWAQNNRLKNNKPLPSGLIGPVVLS